MNSEESSAVQPFRDLYIDLLKRAVCNYLYIGGSIPDREFPIRKEQYSDFAWHLPPHARPHTCQSMVQLDNLENCVRTILAEDVQGDLLEAGVWQGGAVIFMRGILKAYGVLDRRVWAVDSFAGIPESKEGSTLPDPVDGWPDRWIADIDSVKQTAQRYGLLDPNLKFMRGNFADVVPGAHFDSLALVRLDADSYESTRDALNLLYSRVSAGGYIIVDDWHLEGCRRAVLEFRNDYGIHDPIQGVFGMGENTKSPDAVPHEVFWRVGRK